MGWLTEDVAGHEGYVVGLVQELRPGGYESWRELRYPDDDKPIARVRVFQVGCDCGWRSRRFWAPLRAAWHPFCVDLNDPELEDEARKLWRKHAEDERAARSPRLMPAEGT